MKNNYWELKPNEEDFPPGEPVLKVKRGLWYRPDNCGYTDRVIEAGLYQREEALRYCFDGEQNGKWDVCAVPIRMAIRQSYYSRQMVNEQRERLNIIEQYLEQESNPDNGEGE